MVNRLVVAVLSYLALLLCGASAGFAAGPATPYDFLRFGAIDPQTNGRFGDRMKDAGDLDGDGVGEVVAEGTYYESNDYAVYKRELGRWRPVYKGGGGGC